MPLQAVLFDLWETLITDPPERGRPRQARRAEGVRAALARHDIAADTDTLLQALNRAGTALSLMHDDGVDLDSPGRVGLFLDELGVPDLNLPADVFTEIEHAITSMPADLTPLPRPDAVATLMALKALGARTALVSNAGFTTAPALRWMLDHFGMRPYLDILVFSDEHRLAKPDRRIFEHALAGLDADAAACAFVGDSPHNDVAGAISVGMFAVQIGDRARDGISPRARIDRLGELLPVLRAHGLLPVAGLPGGV